MAKTAHFNSSHCNGLLMTNVATARKILRYTRPASIRVFVFIQDIREHDIVRFDACPTEILQDLS
jgi:hypothetical protein